MHTCACMYSTYFVPRLPVVAEAASADLTLLRVRVIPFLSRTTLSLYLQPLYCPCVGSDSVCTARTRIHLPHLDGWMNDLLHICVEHNWQVEAATKPSGTIAMGIQEQRRYNSCSAPRSQSYEQRGSNLLTHAMLTLFAAVISTFHWPVQRVWFGPWIANLLPIYHSFTAERASSSKDRKHSAKQQGNIIVLLYETCFYAHHQANRNTHWSCCIQNAAFERQIEMLNAVNHTLNLWWRQMSS